MQRRSSCNTFLEQPHTLCCKEEKLDLPSSCSMLSVLQFTACQRLPLLCSHVKKAPQVQTASEVISPFMLLQGTDSQQLAVVHVVAALMDSLASLLRSPEADLPLGPGQLTASAMGRQLPALQVSP